MRRRLGLLGLGTLVAAGAAWLGLHAQVTIAAAEHTGVITGVVSGANGPEAGVWVIAETDDLPTKFRKIVVTNDGGTFLLPELPAAKYRLWVRGWGLVDSKPMTATVGQDVKLAAIVAKTLQEAAQVYPANYWVSLLEPPKPSEFPGTGPNGNGVSPQMKTYEEWMNNVKGCERCHQLGSRATRLIPDRDKFETSVEAWDARVQMGQRGNQMSTYMTAYGRQRGLKMFADWTDRIAAGEVPPAPPRPKGVERNVVITMWNWGNNVSFVHDAISTRKTDVRINANGPIYGTDIGNDYFLIVDPNKNTSKMVKVPTRADRSTMPTMVTQSKFKPYRYFGEKPVWTDQAQPHNPMIDAKGRVWITTAVRGPENPNWCNTAGAENKFANYFPLKRSGRHAAYYDPKADNFTLIDTCFGTHHLQFAEDKNETLYFSGGGQAIGWINTAMYDRTHDEKASQGWCPTVIDTNGDGKITKPWNEPVGGGAGTEGEGGGGRLGKLDPKLDTRVNVGAYGIIVSPSDNSVWTASDDFPGTLLRLDPGNNPPETCKSEIYALPAEKGYYRSRGIDVDRNGVIWMALASDHFASFDRRKCKVFNGPTATGRQCDEGWKFYPVPGVTYKGTQVGTDFHYYNWVDQFNTLGLGANLPIANGSNSDSLQVLNPDTGEWIILRVPYPQGFYSRGIDGRIDDPNGGWKGRGIYATYGADAAWHVEGGPNETGNLVKFQVRPDPLAR